MSDYKEEELAGGGFFGAGANRATGVIRDVKATVPNDERNEECCGEGMVSDEAYEEEDSTYRLFSQLIEDLTDRDYSPEECNSLAEHPQFANAVFLAYLSASGTIEERLRHAIKVSIPLVIK